MHTDTSGWSGEGEFTQKLIEALGAIEEIELLRVEDAPATRSDADYNFISNEIYVAFASRERQTASRLFGLFPRTSTVAEKTLTMAGLEARLSTRAEIGQPDYADEGMIQFLKTERIVQPYQTRGYKLVELVRIYEAKPLLSKVERADNQ